jgi:hypothetical protein
MEINEIIETTLDLLSKNTEWEERYAKYIKYLKDKQPKRFIKPEGLSVYSSVSGYKGETYDLRFDGQSVGLVVSRPNEILLYPRDEANEKYFGFKIGKKCVDWHSPEATKFRRFFRDRANGSLDIKLKSPEHRVENCLLKEFAKRTRKEGKELTNIQPIKLNDCFFQMPTPLKASDHNPTYAKQYGGGIDILSRIKIDGESRICVMEVKDENKESESQADAMEQALSYATFVAKLLRSKSGQLWWDFFMGRESVSRQIPSNLNIDVITIMPTGETEEFANIIFDVPQLATKFHCHSLYYDNEAFAGGKFIFSGSFPKHLNQ